MGTELQCASEAGIGGEVMVLAKGGASHVRCDQEPEEAEKRVDQAPEDCGRS